MNLIEFIHAGGSVKLLGQSLDERLSPRQMRYLFATGAFAGGRTAMRSAKAGGASREQTRAAGRAAMTKQVQQARSKRMASNVATKQGSAFSMSKEGRTFAKPAQVLRNYRAAETLKLRASANRAYFRQFPQAKPPKPKQSRAYIDLSPQQQRAYRSGGPGRGSRLGL